MSDPQPPRPRRLSLQQLRKQAKELLELHHAGEEEARQRFDRAIPGHSGNKRQIVLADAQFVLAREHGFQNWAALKRHVEDAKQSGIEPYRQLADDLHQVAREDDPAALDRVGRALGQSFTGEQLRQQIAKRLEVLGINSGISLDEIRLLVARQYSFDTWAELEASSSRAAQKAPTAGLSATPPFYKIDTRKKWLQPRPPLSGRDWEELFDVMQEAGITELRAGGQMTDAVLARVAELPFITAVDLEGSARVTDEGTRHLERMPWLQRLNLTGCSISDRGLVALRSLEALREFRLFHQSKVSDAGLINLAACEQLERVELLGSNSGDELIRALTGKPLLRHFRSGGHVTDSGLAALHEWPVFKRWHGGQPQFSLLTFDAEPNYLLLRGRITDSGLESLAGLSGIFALNLDDSNLAFSAPAVRQLAKLPNLAWLGLDATDELMTAIADLPDLRMLMCQDTRAGDAGFTALSRSRSIELIWGRRCYGLTGAGFAALSRMTALRGLAVSCKNADDAALSKLSDFPALMEFMPMDVPDKGFRHVGRCERLEAVWCMYCRDTGDGATRHLTGLRNLKTYYAGMTRITDESLEILSRMETIEELTFYACSGVTNAGISALSRLPRLRQLNLEGMPRITRSAVAGVPRHVRVSFG